MTSLYTFKLTLCPNMHLTVFKLSILTESIVLSAQLVNKSGFIKYTLVTLH